VCTYINNFNEQKNKKLIDDQVVKQYISLCLGYFHKISRYFQVQSKMKTAVCLVMVHARPHSKYGTLAQLGFKPEE